MAIQRGRKGYITLESPSKDGVALTGTDAPEHADNNAYVRGDQVLVGTGADQVQALCRTGHTSAATGGLTVSSGTLGGDDAANWELVPTGLIYYVGNWSLTETDTTEAVSIVADQDDYDDATTEDNTGSCDVFISPTENIQTALRKGVQGKFTFYPGSIPTTAGAKYFKWTFTGLITTISRAQSRTALSKTVEFSVVGGITETIETAS